MKEILCIIPARKNSKGVKNKNIIPLGGHPLIEYTIKFAKQFENKLDILVSSDSKEIIKISKKYNLINNGIRIRKLSTSTALTADVIKYEIKKISNFNLNYKYILLLQPTVPFRDKKTLTKAIKLIKSKNTDSVVSLVSVNSNHPFRMKVFNNKFVKNFCNFKNENMEPRQKLPKVYLRSGSIYLVKKDYFLRHNSLVGKKCRGIIIKGYETINIDSKEDLENAKKFLITQKNYFSKI
tara:strand:+ start:1857 stop:2570 length:714 start_codon:yes stop_codon:yes gene_type:complete